MVTTRLARTWRAGAYFSLAHGREIGSNQPLRRMPPPIGGLNVRFQPVRGGYWLEGIAQFAWRQTRLSPGDLSDARIGAIRSRGSIAGFFAGTATDLGLVSDGRLVATGESLADVQNRVLGSATSAPLFTYTPGFFILGARAGVTLSESVALTLMAENLTDRNYRWHGSGVDGAGVNVQVRLRYGF
jgi:outer membrane receptor protein involved in Fe transport